MFVNGLIWSWPNFVKICETLWCVPFFGMMIVRNISRYARNDLSLHNQLQRSLEKIIANTESDDMLKSLVLASLRNIKKWLNYVLCFHAACILLPVPVSVIYSFIKNDSFYVIPLTVPFIDLNTPFGYLLNQFTLLILAVVLFLTFICLELTQVIYALATKLIADLLIIKIQKLKLNLK